MFNKNREDVKRKNKFQLKAFSLFEISLVIIIISVVIAGITAGTKLIRKSRLATARSLTVNSPVKNTANLKLWFETSLPNSFKKSENSNGGAISTWIDISDQNQSPKHATQNTSDNQPILVNNIFNNAIPAIRFDGTNDNLAINADFLVNSNYTIFFVEQRRSSSSNNYFLQGSGTSSNSNLQLGYASDQQLKQGHTNNDIGYAVPAYEAPIPRIHTFLFSKTEGKKAWLNGGASPNAQSSSQTEALSSFENAQIGGNINYFNGDIAEAIFFDRALTSKERRNIEGYLLQKIYSSSPSSSGQSGSESLNTCSLSVLGTTSSSVNSGSGTLLCDDVGYSGSISYNCSNGTFETEDTCSCASGYGLSGGTCQLGCSFSGVTGITDGTFIVQGTGSQSCNDTGYSTSDSVNYSCSSGTLNITSGSCDNCSSGYSLVSGSCQQTCTINSVVGITNGTIVNAGSGTFTCNESGYSGDVDYNCSSGTFELNEGEECQIEPLSCSGGSIYSSGNYKYHKFTSNGTFSCNKSMTISKLYILGGGGGPGAYFQNGSQLKYLPGGGGGGGLVYKTDYLFDELSTSVVIGQGGEPGTRTPDSFSVGQNGSSSSFGSLEALGGGGGASYERGKDGGSGGGRGSKLSYGSTTRISQGFEIQSTSPSGGYGADGTNNISGSDDRGANGGSTPYANYFLNSIVSIVQITNYTNYGRGGNGGGPDAIDYPAQKADNSGQGGDGTPSIGTGGHQPTKGASGIVVIEYDTTQ